MLKLAIVIVNYNTRKMTLECLKSIFENPLSGSFEVWLVDNASPDDSIEQIKNFYPQVKLIPSHVNLGFAKGNNLALRKIYRKAEYCLLLNTDTIVYRDSLNKLLKFAENKRYELVSCKLISPDKSFQPNVGNLPSPIPMFFWLSGIDDIFRNIISFPSYHQESRSFYKGDKDAGWLSGSVMLVKREVFNKIGFLDNNIFMYGEDVDFCWRAKKAGFSLGWTDSARVMHIGGASSDKPRLKQWSGEFKGLLYLYKKYYGEIPALLLRILIYLFAAMRSLAFLALGKTEYAKTYAKVITNI